MNLEEFIHRLHFDVDNVRPADWVVDWDDAPLPYKLYRGLPSIPLSAEVPLTLEGRDAPAAPNLRDIGHLLWYVYGLAQLPALPWMVRARRMVPSGGGLYPSELYVYLKLKEVPAGVYHYDAAYHRLVLLRAGDFDEYVGMALGGRCEVDGCFGAVLVSTMFWKNFFKYHNFSYRLQGLDAGCLIGQLLEAAGRYRYQTRVYTQFLDRALHHLLGLSEQEESVYAVIPLSMEEIALVDSSSTPDVTADELCKQLAPLHHQHYVRSLRIREYPMLLKMNAACLQDLAKTFRPIGERQGIAATGLTVPLPQVPRLAYDMAAASRQRYSPASDFVLRSVSAEQVAALFYEATAALPYRNDLCNMPRVNVNACLYGIEGIPDGAYQYDSASHTLKQVRAGDHRMWLTMGMSLHNLNLYQVPVCLHVTGEADHLTTDLGYRGYRIQQMEAGMLVQRLLLAASALGLNGHPQLDFTAAACDQIYDTAAQGTTTLIQIPIGPYRPRPRLEGELHT